VRADIVLCLGEHSRPVYEALLAEALQEGRGRGRVSLSLGECLRLEVESGDISGLRALVNSYLYLAHAAHSSLLESSKAY